MPSKLHFEEILFNNLSHSNYLLKNTYFDNTFTDARNLNINNPEYVYKTKIGNYLQDSLYSTNFSFLYSAINNKSISGLKANWFNSNAVKVSIYETLTTSLSQINTPSSASVSKPDTFKNTVAGGNTSLANLPVWKEQSLLDN